VIGNQSDPAIFEDLEAIALQDIDSSQHIRDGAGSSSPAAAAGGSVRVGKRRTTAGG